MMKAALVLAGIGALAAMEITTPPRAIRTVNEPLVIETSIGAINFRRHHHGGGSAGTSFPSHVDSIRLTHQPHCAGESDTHHATTRENHRTSSASCQRDQCRDYAPQIQVEAHGFYENCGYRSCEASCRPQVSISYSRHGTYRPNATLMAQTNPSNLASTSRQRGLADEIRPLHPDERWPMALQRATGCRSRPSSLF
jgi:hypothetical protein